MAAHQAVEHVSSLKRDGRAPLFQYIDWLRHDFSSVQGRRFGGEGNGEQ